MTSVHWLKIILIITLASLSIFPAQSQGTQTSDKLIIALTSQFPPYTIDHQKQAGIDPELIATVLARIGYQASFIPTPSKRQDKISARNDVDATTGWFNEFIPGCYPAKPYRYWYNALIVPNQSDIQSLSDLRGKRLAIFEDAQDYVDGLNTIIADVKLVIESDSSLQAGRLIRTGRVDAYIGDYVGYYYALVHQFDENEAKKLTNIKHYFNNNVQRICFKNKQIRDKFDDALDALIDEDIYHKIYAKYAPGIDPALHPSKSR